MRERGASWLSDMVTNTVWALTWSFVLWRVAAGAGSSRSYLICSCHTAAGAAAAETLFSWSVLAFLISDSAEVIKLNIRPRSWKRSVLSVPLLQHGPWMCVSSCFLLLISKSVHVSGFLFLCDALLFHGDSNLLQAFVCSLFDCCMSYSRIPLMWLPFCLSLDFLSVPFLANQFSVKAWISQTLTAARRKGIGLILLSIHVLCLFHPLV